MIDRFGYSRRNLIELYDDDATANRIRQTFYELPDKVTASDSVLIYFAGHGFYDEKKQRCEALPFGESRLDQSHDYGQHQRFSCGMCFSRRTLR
ncbi:MAG: hypothetical protein ACLFUS_01480 [Candidatus Sumerlaeia bacterium]